jgi:hypothetical protein
VKVSKLGREDHFSWIFTQPSLDRANGCDSGPVIERIKHVDSDWMVFLSAPLGGFTGLDDATYEFLAAVGRRCEDEKGTNGDEGFVVVLGFLDGGQSCCHGC